jgi:hypothetical protein
MNLQKLNLVELNAQEVKEVGGGWRLKLSIFGFDVVSYDSKRPEDSNWRTDLW